MTYCHIIRKKASITMRLFIASPVILDDYASIQEEFKDIIEGKWVEEENLHLTWVFLGDLKDEKPIINKLQKISPLESEVGIEEVVALSPYFLSSLLLM